MRTLAELGPDPSMIEAVTAELMRLRSSDASRARAQSLRKMSEW
jgi:hypothetical protein